MVKLRQSVVTLQPGNIKAKLCYLDGNIVYLLTENAKTRQMKVMSRVEFPHHKSLLSCSADEWPKEPAPTPCPYTKADMLLICGLIYRPFRNFRDHSSKEIERCPNIVESDAKLDKLAEAHYTQYCEDWASQEEDRVKREQLPELNDFQTQIFESLVSFQGRGDDLVKGLRQMGIKVSDSEVKVNFFSKEIVGLTDNLEEWLKSHDAPEQVSNV